MIRQLTEEETNALQAFADEHGRKWKDKLTSYWYNSCVWGGINYLRALRNDPQWGHEGLNAYQLPELKDVR